MIDHEQQPVQFAMRSIFFSGYDYPPYDPTTTKSPSSPSSSSSSQPSSASDDIRAEIIRIISTNRKLSSSSGAIDCKKRVRVKELVEAQMATLKSCSDLDLCTAGGKNEALVDWEVIAAAVNLTPNEVFVNYTNHSSDRVNRKGWTANEEMKLLSIVKESNECNWLDIAIKLGTGRTPFQCIQHYQQNLNKNVMNSLPWTAEEEQRLKDAVDTLGTQNWLRVSEQVGTRTSNQCMVRWKRAVECHVMLVGGEWTEEEERRLYLASIAYNMPTDQSINNHSNSKSGTWIQVAGVVKTKDDSRCREKWVNFVNPKLNFDPFTEQEDKLLIELIDIHGSGSWAKLAQAHFPGRTDNMLMRRWRALAEKGRIAQQREAALKRKLLLPPVLRRQPKRAISDADIRAVIKVNYDTPVSGRSDQPL